VLVSRTSGGQCQSCPLIILPLTTIRELNHFHGLYLDLSSLQFSYQHPKINFREPSVSLASTALSKEPADRRLFDCNSSPKITAGRFRNTIPRQCSQKILSNKILFPSFFQHLQKIPVRNRITFGMGVSHLTCVSTTSIQFKDLLLVKNSQRKS